MLNDIEYLNSISMDNDHYDQCQRLYHLNKTRPRRTNVTKPTVSNPQANFCSSNEDSKLTEKFKNNLETENRNLNYLRIEKILNQPKINIANTDAVRLRKTKQSTDNSNDNDSYQTQSPVYNNIKPIDSNKSRNRMSMFEPHSYIAGPNHPTKYIEVFALENPKFDQEMFKKNPQRSKKDFNKTKFKQQQTDFTMTMKPEENYYMKEIYKNISSLSLFPVKPIVPIRNASPIQNDLPNQTSRITPTQLIPKMSVKPVLKQTIQIVQPVVSQPPESFSAYTQTQVKLRPKKMIHIKNRDESPYKSSNFANRFSMFESMSQKSYMNENIKLNDYRHINFEVGEEMPMSIKERIKLFSK